MQASLINSKKDRPEFCVLRYEVQPVQVCYYVLHSVLKLLSIRAYAFICVGTTDKPLIYVLSVLMKKRVQIKKDMNQKRYSRKK
jgi:hypothetical protein